MSGFGAFNFQYGDDWVGDGDSQAFHEESQRLRDALALAQENPKLTMFQAKAVIEARWREGGR